ARVNADALPLSFRQHFLDGFMKASNAKGLEIGAGQTGGHLPADIPASVKPGVEQVALKTFTEAYTPAMRIVLILPIIVLVAAVVASMFVRHNPPESSEGD